LPPPAILHAKEVPSEKRGTMFADTRAACQALRSTACDMRDAWF
jgi:alpha-ketoglutarate-dependent taurine dioxygenase